MSLLDKLEKKLGFLAIHNLTMYIIAGQVLTFAMMAMQNNEAKILDYMVFNFPRFADGEVWRILSFLLIPPRTSWIFIAFAWIVFYLMGTAVEERWGAFRYNLYLLIGVLGVVIVGAFYPMIAVSNQFVALSVTFAFACLYPEFELRLFFILPVKVKWLAVFAAAMLAFSFVGFPTPLRWVVIGSLINFPLFFGADFVRMLRSKKRVAEMKEAKRKHESEPFHVCSVCGATDVSHPERTFRYGEEGAVCSECAGESEEKEG